MKNVKATARAIVNFSVLGFGVGVLWMFIQWMMFNAGDSPATNAVQVLAEVSCPFLATPLWDAGWGNVLIPFLNAALYGFVAWLVLRIRNRSDRPTAELQPKSGSRTKSLGPPYFRGLGYSPQGYLRGRFVRSPYYINSMLSLSAFYKLRIAVAGIAK